MPSLAKGAGSKGRFLTTCGSKHIQCHGFRDKIENISYMTDGCMTSHAAASAAVVLATGRPVREGIRINQSAILEHLGGMPEDSRHCALLAATTFQKALRNYARGKRPYDEILSD